MKSKISVVLIALIGITGYFITQKPQAPELFTKDEISKQRAEWWKKKLADPATGEIPQDIISKEAIFAQTLPKDSDFGSRGEDSLIYEPRGPYNTGGRIRSLGIDKANTNILISGGVSGGIYRSTNAGQSWEKVSLQNQSHNISYIVQDKRAGKTNIWYAGTGEGSGYSGTKTHTNGNGIYKSTDNGLTWNVLDSTVTNSPSGRNVWSSIWNLAVDNSNTAQDEVYAAANGGIMKSTDGGLNWKQVLGQGDFQQNYTWVGVNSSGVVYAAIGKTGVLNPGMWRSVDGDNWTNITPTSMPSNFERIVFDISVSNPNVVYFLANTPGAGQLAGNTSSRANEGNSLFKYTYLSGNGSGTGAQWQNLSSNLPRNDNWNAYTFDTQGGYDMVCRVAPYSESVVFVGGTNLFRNTNGFLNSNSTTQIGGYNPSTGGSFDEYRYPNQHPDQHDIIFPTNTGTDAYTVTDGGVSYTSNAGAAQVQYTWKNYGLVSTQFYTVALDHATENGVLVGGTQDNGTQFTYSFSPTTDYSDPAKGDGSYCAVSKGTSGNGSGMYYFSSQNGTTYKTQMGANGVRDRFEQMNPVGTSLNYSFINPFTLDYNDNGVMYMAYQDGITNMVKRNMILNSIQLTNGRGPSNYGWTNLTTAIGGVISSLKTSRSNPAHRLYVGCENGKLYRIENANSTSATLKDISITGPYIVGKFVADIAVHPSDANKVMVVFSNYSAYSVYYSEDGGNSWDGVAGNLEEPLRDGMPANALGYGNGPSISTCAIVEKEDGVAYFLGTSVGLFGTNLLKGHNTLWVQQGYYEIGNVIVHKLDVRDSDGYLAIATYGAGLYGAKITSAEAVNSVNETSIQKTQAKIYPNPIRQNATIEFELNSNGLVEIEVYDQLGRLDKLLFQGELVAGKQSLPLNFEGIASGIHYCKVKKEGKFQTIKVLVD